MNNECKDITIYHCYLKDLCTLLKEMAFEAKEQAEKNKTDFSVGYLMGFHRVISLIQQQAEGFEIAFEHIGIDGIEPDEELT